jgi:hypothetical protein
MGRSLAWLVVDGGSADEIARALAVRRTGKEGQRHRMPLAGRTLEDGRYLIVAGGGSSPAFRRDQLVALARRGAFTFCEFEEHVMWSSIERWEHGHKAWSVAHRGEESPLDLRTTGNLPDGFNALRSAALDKQQAEGGNAADVDVVFDLPIDLARQQTRLHPDDAALAESTFEQLDEGWSHRWHRMPLLVRLAAWVAAFLLLCYLTGALFRALTA